MAAGDIILASSFDSANITYDLDATTNTAGGTVTLTNAQAKTGSYSLRVNRTSTGGAGSNLTIASTNNWTSLTQIVTTFWVRFATLPSTASLFAQMYHAAGSDANLTVNSSGDVLIQYGTGSTTTVASGLATNTWHQIEFATDVSAATHKTKARVNNGTSFEITESSSISTVNGMVLGCGTTGQTYDIYYDDLVMLEGYSTYPGKMIVQTLRPNGDVSGAYTITGGDATRWAATDDAPTSTTTYIGSSTSGAGQVLDFTTYTLGSNETFYGLVANGITGSTATTARSFTVRFQDSGGTNYTPTATWNANVNGWKRSTNILTTRVNRTGGALAQADVDGVRFNMVKSADTRLCNMADVWISAVVKQPMTLTQALTAGLSFTSAQTKKAKKTLTAALSFTSAQTRLTKKLKTLTGGLSFAVANVMRRPLTSGMLLNAMGWEAGDTGEGWSATTTGGTVAASTTFAKSGTYSLRVNRTSADNCYLAPRDWDEAAFNPNMRGKNNGKGCASVWVRFATLPSTNTEIMRVGYYGTGFLAGRVFVDNSGNLTVQMNAGAASATVATLSTGVWYQLEVAVDVSTTTGRVKARVNGGTQQETTGTVSTFTNMPTMSYFGTTGTGGGTYDVYFDDYTVWDDYVFPGPVTVATLRPDTDINSTWTIQGAPTTRWDALNDVPFNTSPAIYSTTANQTQTIGFTTVTASGTIYGIVHRANHTISGGLRNTVLIEFEDGSGNKSGAAGNALMASGGWSPATVVQKTPTGSAYTQSDLDAVRISYTHDSGTATAWVGDTLLYVALNPNVPKALTAALSFTSAQTRKAKRGITATLSFTSAQLRKAKRASTATLSFTSAQTRKAKRAATAALSFTSAQTRQTISSQITKALTATLSFTSTQLRKVKATDTATLSFTSAQTRKAKRAATATLSFTSAQTRKGKKNITASWSGTGALTRRTAFRKALTGALSFTSTQTKKASKTLTAATLSFTSSMQRLVRRSWGAAGSFSGSLTKRVRKVLTATLGFSGSHSTTTVGTEPPYVGLGGWYVRWRHRRRDNT